MVVELSWLVSKQIFEGMLDLCSQFNELSAQDMRQLIGPVFRALHRAVPLDFPARVHLRAESSRVKSALKRYTAHCKPAGIGMAERVEVSRGINPGHRAHRR